MTTYYQSRQLFKLEYRHKFQCKCLCNNFNCWWINQCLSYWNRYNQNEKKVILETKTLRMALSHIVIRSVFYHVYMTFSHFWEKVLLISANIYLFEYSMQHYSYTLSYISLPSLMILLISVFTAHNSFSCFSERVYLYIPYSSK